jgi:hypothetical protein
MVHQVHQKYVQELESTERDIEEARGHIDQDRAAIQEIRRQGGNAQTAEALLHALEATVGAMEQHRVLIREELVLDCLGSQSTKNH